MSDRRGRPDGVRPGWPEYLEPLRPDEMTRHRLRRRIIAAAEGLIEARARSWFDVTAGWSYVLAPVAAGLLLVFGALAYRVAVPEAAVPVAVEAPAQPTELVRSLAPDVEAPPALLIDIAEPTSDALLAAALITP